MTEVAVLLAVATVAAGIGIAFAIRFLPTVRLQLSGLALLAVVLPLVGVVLCVGLALFLDRITWTAFFAWMGLGVMIYATYGASRSRLRATTTAQASGATTGSSSTTSPSTSTTQGSTGAGK